MTKTYGRWPNGVVPYVIEESVENNDKLKKIVYNAINEFNKKTPIKWV